MLDFIGLTELDFAIATVVSLLCGFLIGTEREMRGKPAGISTNSIVIGAAMLFTFLSTHANPADSTRIAAQIVSGVGFLGAGMILKSDSAKKITFLTTAASVWYSAAIGMAIGFGYYFIAGLATLYAIVVPRIPHISHSKRLSNHEEDDD